MAGGVSLGQLTDQLKQIKAQQTNVTQAISANEQEAQNIQNQVTQTTADEEQQSQLYQIVSDNESRDVAAAGDNHKKTLDDLTAQRGKLQKPTAPASDATQEEKDKYQKDLDEYNRASAVLDDEFKAENKRYEEEINKIKEEAKKAKDEAQAKIEECQTKLKELSKDKEANKAEIEALLKEEQAALDAQLKAEKEIEDAKQAEKDEKARLKDEKSGGIDGNTETDRKAEKSDAKADKKALKAAKKGVKGMDGVSDVQMDKKTGTVTYTDAEGNKHTVTVSGSGRGDDAAYSIADTSGHGNELDTYIFDMGFSDGKMTVSDETGHIKKGSDGKRTVTSKNNGDGSTTTSESVAGLTTKSTVKEADGSEKSASVLKANALGADMTTTTVTKNGEATTSTVTKGSDGRTTNTITNFDGTKTTVESGGGRPTVTTSYGSDGKPETVTTQDGNTTKQVVYRDGKATTESTITTGDDGRPTSSVVSDLDANGNATRTVTTNIDKDGNRTGSITVGGHTQEVTFNGAEGNDGYTTTNVKFGETIDAVLQRMGYDKNNPDYSTIKAEFIKNNDVKTKNGKQYFLAGQEVKVPVSVDKYTPTESSTKAVNGKAEEGKWKSWHDAQVAKAEEARKAAEAARAAAQGSGGRKTVDEEMTSRGYYKVEGSRDVYMKDGKYYIPAINHGGGFSNAVEISTNDAFNRGVNLMSSLNARPHVQGGTATNFTLPSGCTLGQGMADKGYWYDSNSGTYYKATNPGKHYRATQLLNSVTVTEISSNEYERLRNQPQFRQGR